MERKQTLSQAWLDSEVEAILRDFGLHRLLASIAKSQEPNVAQHHDDVIQAITMLDKENGNHNHVSLLHLRKCVALARKDFDQALFKLVHGHRVNLVAISATYRMDHDEREACFKHGVERFLFVSRVIVPTTHKTPETLHEIDPPDPSPMTSNQETELALKR